MTAAARGARIVDAVSSAFGASAVVRDRAGLPDVTVRCILRRGSEASSFGMGRAVRTEATARIPYADLPDLRDGYEITQDGRVWRVQGQPTRPDDGRWWVAVLHDKGEAA